MKKLFSRFIAVLVAVSVILGMHILTASADRAIISTNTSQPVGSKFDVVFKFEASDLGGMDGEITFDSTVLEYVSSSSGTSINGNIIKLSNYDSTGAQNATSCSFTVTFKAIKVGKAKVSVWGDLFKHDGTDSSRQEQGITVTVNDAVALSGNADLKSLTVTAGKLSPAFSASVTNYRVDVDYSVTKVLVSAVTADKAATYTVQGSSTMKVGVNTRTVVVTAANGTQKKYVLTINRADEDGTLPSEPQEPTQPEVDPYEITFEGEKWYMAKEYGANAFMGFESAVEQINGAEIPVLKNVLKNRTIVYVTGNDNTESKWLQYNASTASFEVYKYFSSVATGYVLLALPEIATPEGFYKTGCEMSGYMGDAYKYSDADFGEFLIFFGEDADGREGYYRYSTRDFSVQRAVEFETALKKSEKLASGNIITRFTDLNMNDKIIVISIIVFVLLLLCLIVIMIVRLIKSLGKKEPIRDDEYVTEVLDIEVPKISYYTGDEGTPDDTDIEDDME